MAELPLIALLRSPDPIREDILRTFGDDEKAATEFAIKWAWDHKRIQGLSQRQAALRIGVPHQHLSLILNGQKYLPPHQINAFEEVVGNRAVSQTIERFRQIRERALVDQLSKLVAENIVRAA